MSEKKVKGKKVIEEVFEYKVGDLVCLKSDSDKALTVADIRRTDNGVNVSVVWLDLQMKPVSISLPIDTVKKYVE